MKKKGIPSSLLESEEVEEMMKADLELLQSLIEKEDKKKTGLPMKKRKERLSLFLHRRGFSSSMINDAIETFFSSQSEEKRQKEDENSYLLLKKQALKCYNSFVRKYSEPKKRKQAFIQYFLRRGYDYSDLEELIQALQVLGYRRYEINKVLPKVKSETLEDKIKETLQYLAK